MKNKDDLKSNWTKLEAAGAIGNVPRKGVGRFISRAKKEQLIALGFGDALSELNKEGEKKRQRSKY